MYKLQRGSIIQANENAEKWCGCLLIVDEVKEVVTLVQDNIEKVTRTASDDAFSNYISGIGKSNDELISLLDIVSLVEES